MRWRALSLSCFVACAAWPALPAAESSPLAAPNPRFTGAPFVRTWTDEDYAAAPVNYAILQHPRTGFVYAANNYGILEFDGAVWRLYPLPGEGPARTLAIDAAGTVWAGGIGIVAALRPDAHGVLRAVEATTRLPAAERITGNFLFSLATPDGVYAATLHDLVRFAADGSVRRWPIPAQANGLFWHAGALHVSAGINGLLHFAGDRLVPAAPAPDGPSNSGRNTIQVLAARAAGEGRSLLLTTRGPVYWRGAGTALTPLSAAATALFAEEAATAAAFLPDGRLAFSFLRRGLQFLDTEGRPSATLDRTQGLPSNRIEELAVDHEGGLWVAQRTGLARLQLDSPFALHDATLGLSGSPRQLLRFGDRLYVAHNEGVAWRDDATGRFRSVEGLPAGVNLLLEAGGRLYGPGSRVYEITPDDRVRLALQLTLTSLLPLRRSPGYFVGGSPTGSWLVQFDGTNWKNLGPLANVTGGVTRFHEDSEGDVWGVAYDGRGVWRLAFRGDPRPDVAAQLYDESRGLPAVRRRDSARIVELGGRLHVTCAVWSLRLDRATDRFVPAPEFAELTAGAGASVAHTDAQGGRWLQLGPPSSQLLQVSSETEGRWRATPIPSAALAGFVSNGIYHDAATRTLWVAAQGALISVDLTWQAALPPAPPRVLVRRFTTPAGEILAARDLPLATTHPALPAAQNSVRFEYASPSFQSYSRNRPPVSYRTRLAGLDDAWSEWSTSTAREFVRLPFRAFRFEVQARDADGRTSALDTLAFSIAPPWWITPWAWAAYVSAALAAIAGIFQFRTRRLRRRARELEAVVAARTAELAAQNAELARLRQLELDEKLSAQLAEQKARLETLRYQLNPHFLFNALNAFPGLVAEQPEVAGRMALHLSDFFQRMLTRRSEELQLVRDECAMLRAYLDVEKIRWGDSLEVTFDIDPATLDVSIPAFLLLPLVENAIKHGGASTRGTLRLRLTTRQTAAALIFEIANTGAWTPRPAPGVPSTGIGLDNLRQRLLRYYPGAHTFTTESADGWVIVRVEIAPGIQPIDPQNDGPVL